MTDDPLIAIVGGGGARGFAERLVHPDEQDVTLFAVRVDGDQASQRLDRLALSPMVKRPAGEGKGSHAEAMD